MYAIVVTIILGILGFAGYTVFTMVTPNFTPIQTDTASDGGDGVVVPMTTETRIRLTNPKPHARITNPVTISGEARGTWFGEGVFPVALYDGDMQEIAHGVATAQGDWMTEDFIPFTATLYFTKPTTSTGTLKLYKDNPSGLPQNEASIEVEVKF